MNLFQNVKYGVNCREAAERYGVSINRQGKALCPFHNDRHPSLYVADDHFYCFACGAHGDVIDFAANFFDLPLYEAAQRLAADFGVDANQPPTKEVLEKRRQKAEAQQLMENERLCVSVLSDYARVLRSWKMQYAPQSPAEAPDERFEEACHKLDEAVGDHECGASCHQFIHTVLNNLFGSGINRTGRLVEDQYRRICNRSTRNGEKLSLSLT